MVTFISKDRLACKKVKDVIKNIVDNELKYESLKIFCLINHIQQQK